MNIAIIDDVAADRKLLLEFIRKYAEKNKISLQNLEFSNGNDFLRKYNLPECDVLFLDIFMNGINGMELAEKLRALGIDCKIVFTTSSESYAVKSYSVAATYYLVKPYGYEQFEKCFDVINKSNNAESRYIEVKESREWYKIMLRDIVYIDYYNHYVQIHTKNNCIRTYMKFVDIEINILQYPEFVVCYRNIIINMSKVTNVEERDFILGDDIRIPINRDRIKEIKEHYRDYLFWQMEGGAVGY